MDDTLLVSKIALIIPILLTLTGLIIYLFKKTINIQNWANSKLYTTENFITLLEGNIEILHAPGFNKRVQNWRKFQEFIKMFLERVTIVYKFWCGLLFAILLASILLLVSFVIDPDSNRTYQIYSSAYELLFNETIVVNDTTENQSQQKSHSNNTFHIVKNMLFYLAVLTSPFWLVIPICIFLLFLLRRHVIYSSLYPVYLFIFT